MQIAVVHHRAHLICHSRTSLTAAEKATLSNHVRHVALCQLGLSCCNHVSCLRRDYEGEIIGLPKVATYFLLTLFDVGVKRASLRVEKVFVWYFDLFNPLLRLPHAILHIELPNVNENFDSPGEQF